MREPDVTTVPAGSVVVRWAGGAVGRWLVGRRLLREAAMNVGEQLGGQDMVLSLSLLLDGEWGWWGRERGREGRVKRRERGMAIQQQRSHVCTPPGMFVFA